MRVYVSYDEGVRVDMIRAFKECMTANGGSVLQFRGRMCIFAGRVW